MYLNIKNLRTRRQCKKLERRQAGPYKVAQVLSPSAVRLHLPISINAHPVFHVHLLESAAMDPVAGQAVPNPPPIIVDNETEYEVEAVIDSDWADATKTEILFKVKWTGYPDPTWEPPSSLTHCPQMLEVFHRRYPNKPSMALCRSSS